MKVFEVFVSLPLRNECGGLPWWLSCKESACQSRVHGFDPWSRKIPLAMRQLSHVPQLLKPKGSRACALQQEKPQQ